MPVGASSFTEAMRMGSEVYHHLKVCFFFFIFFSTCFFELSFFLQIIYKQVGL